MEGVSQWVLNTATLEGAVTPLFEGFFSHFQIGWSPDGSAIAVSAQFGDPRDDHGPAGTWLVPVDGSQPQVLFESDNRLAPDSHSWAPDGSRVAVLGSGTADGEGFIRVLGIDGSSGSFAVSGPSQGDSIAWSPDGARLAYVNREDGRLTLVNPDGTDFVGLEAGVINGPVWSPDGTLLLVTLETGEGATVVSVSPDPEIPVTVLHDWDEGVQYLAGMSWQPVP
jgi:Tol biopolymer transport system component